MEIEEAMYLCLCLRVVGCKFRNQWCSSYWPMQLMQLICCCSLHEYFDCSHHLQLHDYYPCKYKYNNKYWWYTISLGRFQISFCTICVPYIVSNVNKQKLIQIKTVLPQNNLFSQLRPTLCIWQLTPFASWLEVIAPPLGNTLPGPRRWYQ